MLRLWRRMRRRLLLEKVIWERSKSVPFFMQEILSYLITFCAFSDFCDVYLSGQIPLNPETGEVEGTTIEEQTHQVMKNIKAVLADMGLDYKHIVKTTIFVSDLNDFDKLNEVYGSYLEEPYPARSCVQVARLPKDVKVEIECIVIDTLVYEQQMAAQESGCSGCGGGCDGGCC